LLEAVGPRLSQDDILGLAAGEDHPGIMQGTGETALADHEAGAAARTLALQEQRGRHRRGEDLRVDYRQADPVQPVREIARSVKWVVGEDEVTNAARLQPLQELRRARHRRAAAHEHTVHVDEVRPAIGHGGWESTIHATLAAPQRRSWPPSAPHG